MLIQQILSGIANGFIYALIALGFTAIYSSMRLINFAQGDLFMAGAFIGLEITQRTGLSYSATILATCASCFVLGVLIERVVIEPRSANASEMNTMIRTVAISVMLEGVALVRYGTGEQKFPGGFSSHAFIWHGVMLPAHLPPIAAASILLTFVLAWFLNATLMGTAMRAAAQDRVGAEMIGINVKRTRAIAFGISAALAGGAGILIAPIWYLKFSMGFMMGLKGFTAGVIGGLGSFRGAIVGGLLLGVVENLAAAYFSSTWKDAVVFAILLAVLAIRPSGLLMKEQPVRA